MQQHPRRYPRSFCKLSDGYVPTLEQLLNASLYVALYSLRRSSHSEWIACPGPGNSSMLDSEQLYIWFFNLSAAAPSHGGWRVPLVLAVGSVMCGSIFFPQHQPDMAD